MTTLVGDWMELKSVALRQNFRDRVPRRWPGIEGVNGPAKLLPIATPDNAKSGPIHSEELLEFPKILAESFMSV